jgi:hypothetical protein
MYRVRFGQSGARPHPRAVFDWLRALTRAYSHTLDSSSTTSSLISYLFYGFFSSSTAASAGSFFLAKILPYGRLNTAPLAAVHHHNI